MTPQLEIAGPVILVAGNPLEPTAFPELIRRHPRGVAAALALEEEAQRLSANPTQGRLAGFICQVCQWGNYPRTAERVLKQNAAEETKARFARAWAALETTPARPALALRELTQLRGWGVSFASKHLRFLGPEVCPVLDSVLSKALGYPLQAGPYGRFARTCGQIAQRLQHEGVDNPFGRASAAWFAADVETALYVYVRGT